MSDHAWSVSNGALVVRDGVQVTFDGKPGGIEAVDALPIGEGSSAIVIGRYDKPGSLRRISALGLELWRIGREWDDVVRAEVVGEDITAWTYHGWMIEVDADTGVARKTAFVK